MSFGVSADFDSCQAFDLRLTRKFYHVGNAADGVVIRDGNRAQADSFRVSDNLLRRGAPI
ncbi:hypothetical protein U14_01289 [Candidatus Moduliflexus flocculans]|uniref:Uncharacterized protein n=1 Tax=Candidatus Moduliflexus flocculans TaxID=1499966 RepID=A0A0S6VS02_9BACT|nr:hypothetical protein U14_01289 [Candidatus Moduliflexus flocculans]